MNPSLLLVTATALLLGVACSEGERAVNPADTPGAAAGAPGAGGAGVQGAPCPAYQAVDLYNPLPRTAGGCALVGATCTTDSGAPICRGVGLGTGLAVEDCARDGAQWICSPRAITKGTGCPLDGCEAVAATPASSAPPTQRAGIMYCNLGDSCMTTSPSKCSDGSPGSAIPWNCTCTDGSWSCNPGPLATCP